jgi:hypothetical protein
LCRWFDAAPGHQEHRSRNAHSCQWALSFLAFAVPGSGIVMVTCLLAAGCTGVDRGLRNTVVLHYQPRGQRGAHRFSAPVVLPRRAEPVRFVQPLASEGFWAVFVLCSLDATGVNIPTFYFDIDRFRVQHGDRQPGIPPRLSLRPGPALRRIRAGRPGRLRGRPASAGRRLPACQCRERPAGRERHRGALPALSTGPN